MCYLEGSKLSKKPTFKFVPIRNGIKGLAATCAEFRNKQISDGRIQTCNAVCRNLTTKRSQLWRNPSHLYYFSYHRSHNIYPPLIVLIHCILKEGSQGHDF